MALTRTKEKIVDCASEIYSLDASLRFKWGTNGSFVLPSPAIKSVCTLGIIAVLYHTKDLISGLCKASYSLGKTIIHLFSRKPKQGTALIYGATNKIGKSFAHKFFSEGFNLILADYSPEKLSKLKLKLLGRSDGTLEDRVNCCRLGIVRTSEEVKMDDGLRDLLLLLKARKDIVYFVNCRNVKMKEFEEFHNMKTEEMIVMGYYNMTVLTVLLRKVLKIMGENHEGRIISVNTTYGQEFFLLKNNPYFFATSQYILSLFETLRQTYSKSGIHFLITHSNYQDASAISKKNKIVGQSLSKVGLTPNLYI